MIRFSFIAALACTLLISACGSERDNPLRGLASKGISELFNKKNKEVLTIEILRARLTPEVRAQIGAPVIITELPKFKAASVMSDVGRNGDVTTWWGQDQVGISTKSGLLVSTRGVGSDLMSSDVAGPLAVIKGHAQGTATRIHRYLDGEDQEVLHRFTCTYVRAKSHVIESCDMKGLSIENHYWLNRHGDIWRSQQWINERNGYILLEEPV